MTSIGFSMPSFPRLETESLLLRQETPEDAEAVLAVFSDPAVTQFHDLDTLTTLKEAVGVIERRAQRFADEQGIRWGIARKLDNLVIGSCGFQWDKPVHGAEIGYELASRFWGQGIMTEALQAIMQFGFEKMRLQFVTAEVMLDNIASRSLLKKLGFSSQGVLKQHGFWQGQYHDLEQFVLLRPEIKAV